MRRLTTVLLVVAALVSWAQYMPATAQARRSALSGDTGVDAAASRKATTRLVRDAGLTLNAAEVPGHVVRAVLVDVDADGDTDLVANVGSLDLAVWINDGQGRLTRTTGTAGLDTWVPLPPLTALGYRFPGLDAAIPVGSAPVAPPPSRAGPAPSGASPVLAAANRLTASLSRPAASPRAPPLA